MSMIQADTAENRTSYRNIAMTSTPGGGGSLVMRSFGEVVAFAELMARSQHAIPAHLRGNPGACMAVTMLAMRLEMDPFALASKSYSTKEGATIAYEAQMFAAIIHTRAPIKRTPDYLFEGEGDRLRCTVTAEMKDGSTKVYQSPELGKIPVKNSPLWKGDPQQQIGYYSIRAWARRYCPEVILGIYTPDEIDSSPRIGPERARDVTPASDQPRNMVSKLDALATRQAAVQSAQVAETEHDPATGEVFNAGVVESDIEDDLGNAANDSEPAAQNDNTDEDGDPEHDALIDRLRAKAMRGTQHLKRALAGLAAPDHERLTDHDRKGLEDAAALADRGAGAA